MYKRVRNTNAWIEREGSGEPRFKFRPTAPYCLLG